MIIGSLLSVVALGLFALKPSLTTAVIALIILGVADSFTFTAQNIYYNTLEIVNKFGISKANGIKNTFRNYYDERYFRLSLSYSFGKTFKKESYQNKNNEELERTE